MVFIGNYLATSCSLNAELVPHCFVKFHQEISNYQPLHN